MNEFLAINELGQLALHVQHEKCQQIEYWLDSNYGAEIELLKRGVCIAIS